MVHKLWTQNRGTNTIQEKLAHSVEFLDRWGKSSVKDLYEDIKKLQQRLNKVEQEGYKEGNIYEYKRVEKKLDELLEKEEIMWAQRSRADWLKFGD